MRDDFEAAARAELERQAGVGASGAPTIPGQDGASYHVGLPQISALPPEAPVRPLGTHLDKVYFLDAHSQLREIRAKDLARTMILHLFGTEKEWLYRLWPRWKQKDGELQVDGWDGVKAQEAMLSACANRGIWRPQDYVRGRGTWDAGGELVVHAGHALFYGSGKWSRPGAADGGRMIYPAGVRAIEPAPDEPGALDARAAASKLLELLETWNWAREYDARLLLGWMVAAMMGGALKVRPLAWVTGERGTGKSSLVGEGGVIHSVFGDGILMTANTSAAGLYQKIEYDALPVAIDEIEAKRGNAKTEAVIELARQAYSGGMVLRGGADHEGKQFRARCAVLFGSILIPPLMPQDLSRLALLNLQPFEPGAIEPVIDDAELRDTGRAMLRRILQMWPKWPGRLAVWRDYLREMGHSGRAADQFGTLLAAADLALSDSDPSEDELRAIAGEMKPVALRETQIESSNASRCVDYAMSRTVNQIRGGEQMMVSELIACAVYRYDSAMENPVAPIDAVRFLERAGITVLAARADSSSPDGVKLTKINRVAPNICAMLLAKPDSDPEGVRVAFAPDGDGILELFRGSDWEGIAGAHNPYSQALERVPWAQRIRQTVRVGVRTCKPILIPIGQCVDLPEPKEGKHEP